MVHQPTKVGGKLVLLTKVQGFLEETKGVGEILALNSHDVATDIGGVSRHFAR